MRPRQMPREQRRTPGEDCQRLGELLRSAWERGWQPADLHGYVSKQWDALTVKVIGDAIAADLARHAAATVDPRWHDQLEAMASTVWWPPQTDHLTARAARESGGWAAVAAACGILELALSRLPTLERIGPLPGLAHPAGRTTTADERLLTKVRMMLAKAESTPYEAEAEAFTAAAQSLMARHSIDRAVLEASEDGSSGDGPRATRVHLAAPYARSKVTLLSAVAGANRCKAVWQEHFGFATVVGYAVDLRAVELLFASLLVQAKVAMHEQGSTGHGASTTVFRRSFLTGFAQRIGERLSAVTREETRSASEAHRLGGVPGRSGSAPGPGTDVVQVLGARETSVSASVRERFPELTTMRSRAMLDPDG